MHEIMHAIGFLHEQSRPDRDRHVKVLFQNIKNGESTLKIIDCEKPLFCLKIRGEERKKLSKHEIQRASRARERQSREVESISASAEKQAFRARYSPLEYAGYSLSFLRSSSRIFEQKRDCSQSPTIITWEICNHFIW